MNATFKDTWDAQTYREQGPLGKIINQGRATTNNT